MHADLLGDPHDPMRGVGSGVPTLVGRHVLLRPVLPGDYQNLQLAETTGHVGPRWRFRGSTPSPESWAQAVWSAVLCQYLVLDATTDQPLGLVVLYEPNFQDGHGHLAALKFDESDPTPRMMLGVGLLLAYSFACWPFRKLYLRSPEYNYQQFSSGAGRLFEVEGRLKAHSYHAGKYWDEIILGLTRESWESQGASLVASQERDTDSAAWVKLPRREAGGGR
jgi:hypothetical protein